MMTDHVDDEARAALVERIQALHQREILHYGISKDSYESFASNVNKDSILQWRKQMIQYCFQIVECCDMSHESVIVAISYLDRFLFDKVKHPTSPRVVEARAFALRIPSVFQVLTITCLYTAIKLTEPAVLDINTLLSFTNYSFSAIQIERMESILLEALDWYLTPPTPLLFVNEICQLPNITKIRDLRNDAAFFELVSQQIDMVKMDSEWIRSTASHIAYSTISNAIKIMCISIFQRKEIEKIMQEVLELHVSSNDTLLKRNVSNGDKLTTLQSIYVDNSRIEIREVASMESNGNYNEIDVVLQDADDLTTSSDDSIIDISCCMSDSLVDDDNVDLSPQELQQRLLDQLSNTIQRKNYTSLKSVDLATKIVSRLQSSRARFVDYSSLW
jgi:Cyclin, N-terminal domain